MTLLLLIACHPQRPPAAIPGDAAADWAAVTARAQQLLAAGPVSAPFTIRLETAERTLHAQGALVVRPPDHFRIELSGPIGPPQLVIVGDGAAVTAWVASRQEVHRAEDAEGLLRGLTGGQAGLVGVTAVLLGQLPDLGVPTHTDEAGRTWTAEGAGSLTATAAGGSLRSLGARDPVGGPLLALTLTPGAPYPEALDAHLPTLGVRAELDFGVWKVATPPDAAFLLAIPPGATVLPLELGPR